MLGKLLVMAVGSAEGIVERLSLCPIPGLDKYSTSPENASKPAIRFRLVGLIGKRRIRHWGWLIGKSI